MDMRVGVGVVNMKKILMRVGVRGVNMKNIISGGI
jgi:hypothetical protein